MAPVKMFIPEISSKFRLAEDWTFRLQNEYRNKLFPVLANPNAFGPDVGRSGGGNPQGVYNKVCAQIQTVILNAFRNRSLEGGIPFLDIRRVIEAHDFDFPIDALKDVYPDDNKVFHSLYMVMGWLNSVKVTLPAGTLLSVDRIYIRKGVSEYSSVTFYVKETNHALLGKGKGAKRFWAKLPEVNEMVIDSDSIEIP